MTFKVHSNPFHDSMTFLLGGVEETRNEKCQKTSEEGTNAFSSNISTVMSIELCVFSKLIHN